MVGCGAAGGIAGAFGAPLAGAFYAFELVIGGYTPASLTPVGVAAVAGYFVTHAFSPLTLGVGVGPVGDVLGRDLAIAALLGILAALVGIGIMRGVALCEALLAKTRIWAPLRPALGGICVGLLALAVPQPAIVWRPIPFGAKRRAEMAAYAQRHYGIDDYHLRHPHVIVEHYTVTATFQQAFDTFAPDVPDSELHELPGTCAHFVIDRDGKVRYVHRGYLAGYEDNYEKQIRELLK